MNNLVKFSDGDGSGLSVETEFVTIETADNGYVIHLSTEDDNTKHVFAYKDRADMMNFIKEVLGV